MKWFHVSTIISAMQSNNRTLDLINKQLLLLLIEARQYSSRSFKRRRCLTQMIRLIQQSNKLWHEHTPYYEDALQQTWLFFCQNVCEACTGKQFDPSRSSMITWLNQYLKWRLQDFRIKTHQHRARMYSPSPLGTTDNTNDVLTNLAAPPDIPPLWNMTLHWIKTDPAGILGKYHILNRPDVTCQVLLLRRIFSHRQWDEISLEFDLPVSTLSSFYQRKCLPAVRNFAELQGFL